MTLPIFPANPGTFVLSVTAGDVLRTPVIAWAPDADNPYNAPHPMTARGISPMKGKAVLHPCGMVVDSRILIAFDNESEWAAYADGAPEIEQREPKAKPTTGLKKPPVDMDPATGSLGLDITWITKAFKTNSFYRYTDEAAEVDFVFQVEPDVSPPKQTDTVVKIKRDEFMALKKELDVGDVEDMLNGVYPGMADLGGFGNHEDVADEEEDDDDGGSLI